jgi:uncharacterized protein (TIGR00251 family)
VNCQRWYRWNGSNLVLRIKVQPRSASDDIIDVTGDALRVRLRAPPTHGKANQALLAMLATAFSVPKRNVTIRHGHGSRVKTVVVAHPLTMPEALLARMLHQDRENRS